MRMAFELILNSGFTSWLKKIQESRDGSFPELKI